MKRIKYIAYYDRLDSKIKRNFILSASNKIDYIISVLNKNGVAVDIISFSGCVSDSIVLDPGGEREFGINTLKHFSSFGPSTSRIVRLFSRFWQKIQLFCWFILNVRRNEKIIVYHSLGYCRILTYLKLIKRCSYIGEIEEIYQDVSPQSESICKSEYRFIDICDRYIFPTQLLNERLNHLNKPHTFIHGIYQVEYLRNVDRRDSDIHVVYAGTFDKNKGGAAAAVTAATYLPMGYHLHICGFGNELDVAEIRTLIQETSLKSKAKVTYEGLIQGEEFICFLQKCQIGLSTQDPTASFNATSFPSKILTYLANGLNVVSIRIPAVELSGVGHCISYYDEQTPQSIAAAILNCNILPIDETLSVLETLDEEFHKNIMLLIE